MAQHLGGGTLKLLGTLRSRISTARAAQGRQLALRWLDAERARLGQRYTAALEALVDAYDTRGEFAAG